jgi:hypothetical protein
VTVSKISFLARADLVSYPIIQTLQPHWNFFPKEEWPLCSLHVAAVTFSKEPCDWPRWTCPQVDAGWTRQTTAKFRSIFDDKEAKVRKVWHDASRFSPAVPTWLVIVSDLYNDLTSHLFPGSQDDREELFASIKECKYEFAHSPFAEVWLYADFNHSKLRIFPSSELSNPSIR